MFSSIFNPSSVALIGASKEPGKLGHDILGNLKNLGYKGNIYPVNPKGGSVLGLPVIESVSALPEIPDVVLIVIPAPYVNASLEECGEKGIKNIVVISAGFKEAGPEGAKKEEEMKKIVEKYQMNLVGPNCLGIIDTERNLNASFAEGMPMKGGASLISQSGAMAVAMIDWAYDSGLGFSKIISMGNKAGASENELLEYLGDDPETKVILMYLESIVDGQKFLEIARKVSLKKPIIMVKSGTSEAGAGAIASHTGSLAGSEEAVKTALKQAGIIRADSVSELFDYAKAFTYQNPPKGNKVAIVTNAGGPGIMATDAIERTDLELAELSEETKARLQTELPITASVENPVDVIGDALIGRYRPAIQKLLEAEEVDSLLVILTPQVMTEVKRVAMATTAIAEEHPEKTCISAFMGGENIERGKKVFRRHRFPNFDFPENAIYALNKMYWYAQWKKQEQNRIDHDSAGYPDLKSSETDALFEGRKSGYRFTPKEVEVLLKKYGISFPEMKLATNLEEAVKFSNDIQYPVVMKIASPQIYHKSDVGGLKINIKNDEEAKMAYEEIMTNVKKNVPDAEIDGITVEAMLTGGREIIIGVKKDSQFGHMILFGLGGIYVEILKDVTFRIAPIGKEEALRMIHEINAIEILKGARGEKPVDFDTIADILVRVSQIVEDYPQIAEFEMNPLMATEERGVVAVDTNCIVE